MENKTIRELHRENIELYPTLTQEEVVRLYESVGITSKTMREVIEELEDKIREKESEIEDRAMSFRYQQELYDVTNERNKYEALLSDTRRLYQKICGTESIEKKELEEILASLEDEIQKRTEKIQKLSKDNTDRIDKLLKEIDELSKEVKKLWSRYYDSFHLLYNGLFGRIPRERPYPSIDVRNKIVCGHLNLAKKVAREYYYKLNREYEFDDLWQMAYEGLLSAAYYYISSERAKFTTYAKKCMSNKIIRETIKKSRHKKSSLKLDEFFTRELDRMNYVKMLLESFKKTSSSGHRHYNTKYPPTVTKVLMSMQQQIRKFNSDMRLTGETKRILPSFRGDRTQEKLDIIIKRAVTYIKQSKIRDLLTDEDIELINLEMHRIGYGNEQHELRQLLMIIDLYCARLSKIKTLISVEQEFSRENSGIVPTDEEILTRINAQIKEKNREIYKLKKEGFFKRARPQYRTFNSYYNTYLEMFDVDFLKNPKYDTEGSVPISRQKEKDMIRGMYNVEYLIETMEEQMRMIESSLEEEFYMYEFEEENSYPIKEFFGINASVYYFSSISDRKYTKKEAIEECKREIERIQSLTEEQFLTICLDHRKRLVLRTLREPNATILDENLTQRNRIQDYDHGDKYYSYWTMDSLNDVRIWLNRLLSFDLTTASLLDYSDKKPYPHKLSLEEEVENKMFLEDYYRALENLSVEQRRVMQEYYDENGVHSKSAKEIGKILKMQPRQVYQVKNRALKSLRQNSRIKGYLDEN